MSYKSPYFTNFFYSTILFLGFLLFADFAHATDIWTVEQVPVPNNNIEEYYQDCLSFDSERRACVFYGAIYRFSILGIPIADMPIVTVHRRDEGEWGFIRSNGRWYNFELGDTKQIFQPRYFVDGQGVEHFLAEVGTSMWDVELSHTYNPGGEWITERVPVDSWQTAYRAVMDNTGGLHILAYTLVGDKLYYVTNGSGSWEGEDVCEISQLLCYDIAVGPDGTVYVCGVSENAFGYDEICCYVGGTSGWSKQVLPLTNLGNVMYLHLACDESGVYLVGFERDLTGLTTRILYGDTVTGSWRAETMFNIEDANEIPFSPGFAVDTNGVVHFTCVKTMQDFGEHWAELCHWQGEYGAWSQEVVAELDPNEGYSYFSLGVDGDGKLYLAGSVETSFEMSCFYGGFGNWQKESVAIDGQSCGEAILLLDSSDEPHLVLNDIRRNVPLHVVRGAEGWTVEHINFDGLIRTIRGESGLAATMDDSDNIYIAGSSGWEECYLIDNTDGQWQTQAFEIENLIYPAIAVGGAGDVHFNYYQDFYNNKTLKSAHNSSGSWVWDDVESSGLSTIYFEQQWWQDMVIESSGTVHLAYMFGESEWDPDSKTHHITRALRYAWQNGGSWHRQVLTDDLGPEGGMPSIALDSWGRIHISFMDSNDYGIKYATNASGSWIIEKMPISGGVDARTAIVTDSLNQPYVCYVDSGELKIGYRNLGTWQTVATIAEEIGGSSDGFMSMEIDSNDKLHLSFKKSGLYYYATNSITRPLISTEPLDLDFFVVENGAAFQTLTIRNDGSGDLIISSIAITGPNAGKFSVGGYISTIPPGGICLTQVNFDTSESGEYEATLNIYSNDPDNPAWTVPLYGKCFSLPSPSLECKTSLVDFGEVVVKEASDPARTLRFSNTGTATQTINSIILTDPNNFYYSPKFLYPISLDPDEYYDLDVTFNPQSVGQFDAMLNVYTYIDPFDPQPACAVVLVGEGIPVPAPEIAIVPQDGDIGEIQIILDSKMQVYSILNNGDADLIITDITTTGDAEITVDLDGGPNPLGTTWPVTITADNGRTFSVTFAPIAVDGYSRDVVVSSNNPAGKFFTINFTGQGIHWNKCDFDIDGNVDFSDFATLALYWMSKPGEYIADVAPEDPDGLVNILDLDYFASQWLFIKGSL